MLNDYSQILFCVIKWTFTVWLYIVLLSKVKHRLFLLQPTIGPTVLLKLPPKGRNPEENAEFEAKIVRFKPYFKKLKKNNSPNLPTAKIQTHPGCI